MMALRVTCSETFTVFSSSTDTCPKGLQAKVRSTGTLSTVPNSRKLYVGSDCWIEHFIATGSSVGRLQVKHSGMRSGLHFHLEGLIEVIHRLHLWGSGIEGI